MTDPELRLKCMELAMEQARRENLHANRTAVAELQTWFYNHIRDDGPEIPAASSLSEGKRRGRKPGTAGTLADILS